MDHIKCVVVGDGTVGKTCMLISYTTNSFPTEYSPTIFDNYCANVLVDGKPYQLGLWDTAGQEDYDNLRNLSYGSTNIFIVCYSVTNRTSFENVERKWVPEIRHYSNAPILVVGTKTDLRTNHDVQQVLVAQRGVCGISTEEGRQLAQRMRASGFVECSALTQHNLKLVFDAAIRVALRPAVAEKRTSKWSLLRGVFGGAGAGGRAGAKKNADKADREAWACGLVAAR